MYNMCFDPPSGGSVLPEHTTELLLALDQVFLSIVKLELDTGKSWLLQSKDQQNRQPYDFDWNTYLSFYHSVLEEDEADKLSEAFSLTKLTELWIAGNQIYRANFSCRLETGIDWLEMVAFFTADVQKPVVYIFTRQSRENYLLRRIIDLYVYDKCDCFIYLDAKNNSYTMFSGKRSGTPLPPEVCDDYSAEIIKYAEEYVVPEEREMVMREMSLDRVLEELEQHEVHAFTCGMWEADAGYTRKRLEYRYYDRRRQMILLSRTDITSLYDEQQKHTQDLEEALLKAQTDPLTGIWNCQGIQDVVEKGLKQLTKKAALFFLDLDDFKLVNDTYGHVVGDNALQMVADILKQNIREADHAARIGGDEFVVFLSDIPSAQAAENCARRICEQMAQECLEHAGVRLSGSIGIAIAPEDGMSYDELVRKADDRVYRAKSNGKNQFSL